MSNGRFELPGEMKRNNYFTSQFLVADDFNNEQSYHLQMRRLHNRSLHIWGIVDGLQVTKDGTSGITVAPGLAIDKDGKEIVVPTVQTKSIAANLRGDLFVVLAYQDNPRDSRYTYSGTGNDAKFNRTVETFTLDVVATAPDDGSVIKLGKINVNATGAMNIPEFVRRMAGSRVNRGQGLGEDDLYIAADGKVGIGTTAPVTKLQVHGAGAAFPASTGTQQSAGHIARFKDSSNLALDIGGSSNSGFWLQPTNVTDLRITYPLLLNPTGGNVGIGMARQPVAKLQVEGGGKGFPAVNGLAQSAGLVARLRDGSNLVLDIGGNGDQGFWLQSTADDNLALKRPLLLNPNGGNVGIGTTVPGATLQIRQDLSGGIGPTLSLLNSGWFAGTEARIDIRTYDEPVEPNFRMRVIHDGDYGANVDFATKPPGREGQEPLTSRLYLRSNGNIGIGTTAPLAKLQVEGGGTGLPYGIGTDQSPGLVARFRDKSNLVLDIGGNGDGGFWLQATDVSKLSQKYPLLLNPSGGNVGIGTTIPKNDLHIFPKANVGGLTIWKPDITVGQSVGVRMGKESTALNEVYWGYTHKSDIGWPANYASFGFNSQDPVMVLNSDRLVGVRTTDPKAALHVVGSSGSAPIEAGPESSARAVRLQDSSNGVLDIGGNGAKGFWLQAADVATPTNYPLILNPNGGNVGIGAILPGATLQIQKDVRSGLGPTLSLLNNLGGAGAEARIDINTTGNTVEPNFRMMVTDDGKYGANVDFTTRKQGGNGTLPLTSRLFLQADGKVGLGTKSPRAKLQVEVEGKGFPPTTGTDPSVGQVARFKDSSNLALDIGGNDTKGFWLQSTDVTDFRLRYPLLLNPNGGNVGIGTTNPGFALQVGDHENPSVGTICVAGRNAAGAAGSWRRWTLRTGEGARAEAHKFRIRDENVNAERLTIDEEGLVGIGAPSPEANLHVVGNLKVTGKIILGTKWTLECTAEIGGEDRFKKEALHLRYEGRTIARFGDDWDILRLYRPDNERGEKQFYFFNQGRKNDWHPPNS